MDVFTVTAAVMFASTVVFTALYVREEFEQRAYLLLPLITGIAGVMYGVMGLSAAGTVGDIIVEARYFDWLVTTPLIVAYLGVTAGASRRLVAAAMAVDAGMIAVGYAATVTTGAVSWALFAVSFVAFVALLYLLVGKITAVASERPPAVRGTFQTVRDLTVVVWFLFPLAWLAGPFGPLGLLQTADYHFVFAVLDVVSKVGFDAVIALRASKVVAMLDADSAAGDGVTEHV